MARGRVLRLLLALTVVGAVLPGVAVASSLSSASTAGQASGPDAETKRLAAYWTADRMRSAVSRDIVVDARGRSFLRAPGGGLEPYGTGELVPRPALTRVGPEPSAAPQKGPGGTTDTTPPTISQTAPSNGASLSTTSVTFTANVTDSSGVRSVSVTVIYPDGTSAGSFATSNTSGSTWSVTLNGFTTGNNWRWSVTARDGARNTATSSQWSFDISAPGGGGGGGGGDGVVTNTAWTTPSQVLNASGRIFFDMPANKSLSRWQSYVCSGTAVSDGSDADGRSMILTAAHCIYDDAYKAFARNVLFIPNQQGTTAGRSDRDCTNDPVGCWAPSAGVVDQDWTSRKWPNNIPWDYGYYVVPNSGRYSAGQSTVNAALEIAVNEMTIRFSAPAVSGASAYGYSYSEDPKLMYCAETRTPTSDSNNWWLGQCGLSGGASGGPWLDEFPSVGSGEVISVNSWGYSGSPGMAGPKLDASSGTTRTRNPVCIYRLAKNAASSTGNITGNTCPAS